MALIRLNFTKINAERKKFEKKEYKVKQDLVIKNVTITSLGQSKDSGVITVDFAVKVSYAPDFAEIVLEGLAAFTEPPEGMKLIKETYEKKKKLPAKWGMDAMNVIMLRSHVKILQIAQDIGVPPHIQLPIYASNAKKSTDYIG